MAPTRYYRRTTALILLLTTVIMGGCGNQTGTASQSAPTISSLFEQQPTIKPAATRDPNDDNTIPLPTTNPTIIAQATITALGENKLIAVPIYNDVLSDGWSLTNSFQTTIDIKNQEYVNQGRFALKAQPQLTLGTLYFTLDETTKRYFPRSKVQALQFYLSGGANSLDKDAMTVTIVGSNAHPYWVKNDTSVKIDGRVTDNQPVFSETRLYFLGVNKAIPPKTYIKVTVWLNDLIYDPAYTYVTGFYFKTDKASASTFYIDNVILLMQPLSL